MSTRPTNRAEAEKAGFTVDTHCYPWFAYKGPRFKPDEGHQIMTDLEAWAVKAQPLLRECLGDYGHPNFTDRHGMADRLRDLMKEKPQWQRP